VLERVALHSTRAKGAIVAELKRALGIPTQDTQEQEETEVVKAPEFDLTQFAKGLVPLTALVLGGVVAALKAAKVDEVTEPAVLVGILGVVAAAVLGASFVSAIDIAARAFLSGEGSAEKAAAEKAGPADSKVIPMPSGTLVWLQGDDRPLPLLAVSKQGTEPDSYLVASGETFEAGRSGETQKAIKGTPRWEPAEKIAALKPPKWKA
jgi:hypothetical protein